MLLPQALALAEARAHLAALADQAATTDSASAYEHALINLDRAHGDHCPTIDGHELTGDRATLRAVATAALEDLTEYGADPLSIELVIATLDDAYSMDRT